MKVYFIGAGPGDPDLITVKGRRIIRKADLVLYAGSLVPREIAAQAKQGAEVVDSSSLTLEQTHELLRECVRNNGLAARVHTGDPSLYGAVAEQAALLERDGIEYEIIPGVTAAFAAAAAARVSFTAPERTQSLVLTRTGGRTPVPEAEGLRNLAAHGSAMAVYLSGGNPELVRAELLAAGLDENTAIVAAHRVGWEGEMIVRTNLAAMVDDLKGLDLARQTIFLVLPGQGGPGVRSKLYDGGFAHKFRPEDETGRGV